MPINVTGIENEENSVFEFPVILNQSNNRTVTVGYETRSLTAIEGEDFIENNGTLTFEPGVTSLSINVEIVVDEFVEEDEEFKVVLTSSQNGVFVGGAQEAIGTITNDDTIIKVTDEGYDAAGSYPGKTLVWSDEFNGTEINSEHWMHELGNNGGWGNQEWEQYTASETNSYVANGNLMIVAEKEGTQFTSARMRSAGMQEFQYGRIDVRAVLPEGKGIWPAIWMLGHDFPSVGWPACGEIDIMELIGHVPGKIYGTAHYGADWTQHQFTGGNISLPFPEKFYEEFHVFSIDWDETGIRWLLDDEEYFSINTFSTGSQPYPYDDEFYFIMNIAVGGTWPGYPDETTEFPQFMAVDYIRVYQ